jgi:hypothetical protein
MWVGDSKVYIAFDHVLMLSADDWTLPSERSEALN